MESVNRAGPIAAGVALLHDSSRPLLAQAARAQGAADREALPPAPKAVTLQLGGHRLTAVPIGPPGKGGKTLYEVTWQGIAVRTVLTGQIGPRQFEPGSPLKRQLEQALAARSRGTGWLRPLENAGEALTGWVQDIVDPPLGRVRPWRGNVAGARVTARPLRADGERITWRIDIERGGQPAGTFEAVLSGQLGEAQFRPLRGGGVSPLKAQVLDVLRAPQKRLQDLAETVVLRDAPGGETLEATVVAMQRLRGGRWQTVGYAVGEIRGWSDRPGHPGQRPQALGYLRRSVHRGERITLTDGTPAASVAQARARVLEMLEHRGLSLVSSAGARAAAETRRQQSADVADLAARLGAAGPARLGRWSAPVPLPKPLEQMTAAERIQYTVRVARQTLPADVARQLQSLITPQTAAALAAYAAAHALGLGFIADGVALGLSGPDAVEGVRQFARYLRTALQARHAMELSEAGRQLSELAAPLVVNGGAMLATFGAGRAARARRGRPPAPRAAAVTPATPNRRGPSVGSAAAPTTATVRVERTSGHPLFQQPPARRRFEVGQAPPLPPPSGLQHHATERALQQALDRTRELDRFVWIEPDHSLAQSLEAFERVFPRTARALAQRLDAEPVFAGKAGRPLRAQDVISALRSQLSGRQPIDAREMDLLARTLAESMLQAAWQAADLSPRAAWNAFVQAHPTAAGQIARSLEGLRLAPPQAGEPLRQANLARAAQLMRQYPEMVSGPDGVLDGHRIAARIKGVWWAEPAIGSAQAWRRFEQAYGPSQAAALKDALIGDGGNLQTVGDLMALLRRNPELVVQYPQARELASWLREKQWVLRRGAQERWDAFGALHPGAATQIDQAITGQAVRGTTSGRARESMRTLVLDMLESALMLVEAHKAPYALNREIGLVTPRGTGIESDPGFNPAVRQIARGSDALPLVNQLVTEILTELTSSGSMPLPLAKAPAAYQREAALRWNELKYRRNADPNAVVHWVREFQRARPDASFDDAMRAFRASPQGVETASYVRLLAQGREGLALYNELYRNAWMAQYRQRHAGTRLAGMTPEQSALAARRAFDEALQGRGPGKPIRTAIDPATGGTLWGPGESMGRRIVEPVFDRDRRLDFPPATGPTAVPTVDRAKLREEVVSVEYAGDLAMTARHRAPGLNLGGVTLRVKPSPGGSGRVDRTELMGWVMVAHPVHPLSTPGPGVRLGMQSNQGVSWSGPSLTFSVERSDGLLPVYGTSLHDGSLTFVPLSGWAGVRGIASVTHWGDVKLDSIAQALLPTARGLWGERPNLRMFGVTEIDLGLFQFSVNAWTLGKDGRLVNTNVRLAGSAEQGAYVGINTSNLGELTGSAQPFPFAGRIPLVNTPIPELPFMSAVQLDASSNAPSYHRLTAPVTRSTKAVLEAVRHVQSHRLPTPLAPELLLPP